jgi:hypothetical protein
MRELEEGKIKPNQTLFMRKLEKGKIKTNPESWQGKKTTHRQERFRTQGKPKPNPSAL